MRSVHAGLRLIGIKIIIITWIELAIFSPHGVVPGALKHLTQPILLLVIQTSRETAYNFLSFSKFRI